MNPFSSLLECSILGADFQKVAIFGPRRAGTNYLQHLVLLNTLNLEVLHLDATTRDHGCRLLVNGFEEYGSKHSLGDRPISQKLNERNINLVIVKRDIKSWLYSRYAYNRSFCANEFRLDSKVLAKWINNEYLQFMQDLAVANPESYVLLTYEDLSIDGIREILASKGVILTRYPLEMKITATPGGGNSGRKYLPRRIGGNKVIEEFVDQHSEIKSIRSAEDFLRWSGLKSGI